MTYLKGNIESGRAKIEKVFQQGTVELEGGPEFDEDWAEVVVSGHPVLP